MERWFSVGKQKFFNGKFKLKNISKIKNYHKMEMTE